MNKLAIIIPAYKYDFFEACLDSILQQTDTRFNLYIGNDGGDRRIGDRVKAKQKETQIPIQYHYFEDRIGAERLCEQWVRCIELSTNEPYIWLFPDDDVMGSECVGQFYEVLKNEAQAPALIRFNMVLINQTGEPYHICPPNPRYENQAALCYHFLNNKRENRLSDFIFSRVQYEKKGFVAFPLAWGSDICTWLHYASDSSIVSIDFEKDTLVYFRVFTNSISGSNQGKATKISATIDYLAWINTHIIPTIDHPIIHKNMLVSRMEKHFFYFVKEDMGLLPMRLFRKSATTLASITSKPVWLFYVKQLFIWLYILVFRILNGIKKGVFGGNFSIF